MDIAIVGCGIGGLAAASLLAQSGRSIEVFDRFDHPEPVGSGLVIQTVALPVLDAIGAMDAVLQYGARNYHMLGLEADTGQKVLDVRYGPQGGHDFGLGIHRAALFDCLLQAAKGRDIKFRNGCEIATSDLVEHRRYISDTNGQRYGPYDLVVDGSGTGSALSPLVSKPLEYGAVWGTVDWPEATFLSYSRLEQRYRSATNMIGVLPIGRVPGDPSPKAAFFWSLRQSAYGDWRRTPFNIWQDQAVGLWPDLEPFVQQLTSHDDLTMARYGHGTLRRPFGERIAYIGDAAHRASPQLGQGANMALLDAFALSRALEGHSVENALKLFAQARRRHIAVYQAMSWAFTPMYQSNSRLPPFLRDWMLAPASQLAPLAAILQRLVKGNLLDPYRGFFH